MKRAALYVRVSTVQQAVDDKVSLGQQESDCRAYCESKGYEIVELYRDVASGSTKRRADFQRMLAAVREGRVDIVVSWTIDRLSRSIYATSALMEALEGTSCNVECARESVDLDMLALHAAVGQVELRRIKERTSMGKRGAARAGRLPSGQSVYGYRAGEGNKPVIDETEAPAVRRMFAEYRDGRTTREIAAGLDADGILPRRGASWSWEYIGMRLRDRTYIGHGSYGKYRHERTESGVSVRPYKRDQWIELPHPAIVDEALFAAVQQRLSNRRVQAPRRAETREFLLRHLLRCDECGKGFVCRGDRKRKARFYECFGTFRNKAGCRANPQIINAELLEAVVWKHVVAWVSNPDLLEAAVRSQLADFRERGTYANLEDMRTSLAKLTGEEDRVIALCSQGKITEAQLDRQLGRFTERREHYEQRITVLEAEAGQAQQQMARVADFRELCGEIAQRLDTLGFDERVQLVRAVVDSVTLDGVNNVRIDIAVFPERLPVGHSVATKPTGTLWPEIATR